MKRSSIVGPLILIALGVLFLVRNFLPDFRILEVITLYWPYLLIGWGILRVIEVLNWRSQGRLTPRGGMNGGEWVLVIFICLIGSGMYAARNAELFRGNGLSVAGLEFMGENYDYPLSATHTGAGRNPRILIDNMRGDVRITGVDSEDIRLTGTKTIRALNRSDADREHNLTALEVARSGDQIIVRTNTERAVNSRQVKTSLELLVPKGSIIEGHGRMGDFDVENLQGAVEINSENAGVRLNNIGGNVRLDLRRSDIVRIVNALGNVDLKGRGQDVELDNVAGLTSVNGLYSGDLKFRNLQKPFRFESDATNLRVERVEGEVEMVLGRLSGRKLVGPIQVRAKSKDVELADFTNTVDINLDRGDIELRPLRIPLTKLIARTDSGDVEIILPDGAKFDLKAEVKRGHIENNYGAPLRLTEEGRAATLAGANGGPEVRLLVDRGEVRVRKWSVTDVEAPEDAPNPPKEPKPPAPPKKNQTPAEQTPQ